MAIYIARMKAYTTPEVAKLAGIGLRTLYRWLKLGAIPEPERGRIGGLTVRLWSEKAVRLVREHKRKFYAKGRGRKPKQK